MRSDTILLTGASGFSGRVCYRIFIEAGYNVIPIVRKPAGLANEVVVDLEEDDAASNLLKLPAPAAIVHLASNVNFEPDATDQSFFSTNVLTTSLLCQICCQTGAHMILASGTIVHGTASKIVEDTEVAPQNAYGRAKALAEQIVRASGTQYTILRIAGIYGRHGPSHLALNRIIDNVLDKGDLPKIFATGRAKRNYIYVEDLAKTILDCLQLEITGTHLAAGPDELSLAQMMNEVCAVLPPGQQPIKVVGEEAVDAVVRPSAAFRRGRSFHDCLIEIAQAAPV